MNPRAWGASFQNREEKFELKRQAVLLSAARLLRNGSYDSMSLADIAVDLGVAKPTVYYYFRNKEQIVRELMKLAVARMLDPGDHPDDYPETHGLSGAQRFERFLRRCIRVISDDVGACLFTVYPHQLPDDVRKDFVEAGQPVIEMAAAILRRGIADGSVGACDPVLVYNFAINALRCVPQLLERNAASASDIADAFVTLVTNGIAPRA
ncbi:MAG: TetR/AcrR family transcriptional regulator [Rhizomicrobium sp.]